MYMGWSRVSIAGAAVWVGLHVVTGLTFLGKDPYDMGMVGTDC